MGIRKIIEDGFEVIRDSNTTAAVAAAATVLPVGSAVSNFAANNRIRISLSTGATQDTTVQSIDTGAQTITIAAGGLTANVNSGASIRIRLMDTFDAMELSTSGVSISSTQPLIGEMLFIYTGTDPNAIVIPQLSPDGAAHFFSILGAGIALSTSDPIRQKYVAATHIKLTVINQSTDDFDVLIGFA